MFTAMADILTNQWGRVEDGEKNRGEVWAEEKKGSLGSELKGEPEGD